MQRKIASPKYETPTEWILGKAVPKVAPSLDHGLIQGPLWRLLEDWAEGRGKAVPEWEFRLTPRGEKVCTQIPDIAYLSFERMGDTDRKDLQYPSIPPNLAVEVLSPRNTKEEISEKTRVYLAAGTDLVLIIDPAEQTIETHVLRKAKKTYRSGDTLTHRALPGFKLDVAALFKKLDLPNQPAIPRSIKKKVDNSTTRESHRRQ